MAIYVKGNTVEYKMNFCDLGAMFQLQHKSLTLLIYNTINKNNKCFSKLDNSQKLPTVNLCLEGMTHIISTFNVTHHLYADDIQMYLALDSRNSDSSIAELTECLTCVKKWMDGLKLKLNPENRIHHHW